MKKHILFLVLIFTSLVTAQDFAKDTLIVNGTQPATILRLKKTKVFIVQNKELSTPYIKQKDGSFISNGMPFIQIHIDSKKHTIGNTFDYVDILFEKLSPGPGGSNEIITIDNVRALLQTKNFKKDKRVQIFILYPLSDRFINLNFVFKYSDDEDKENKIKGIEDILNNGFIVLENYYLTHKE